MNIEKHFNGDKLAASTWVNKYALKDSEGNLMETIPEDMFRRMAEEFARIEAKYDCPITEAVYQALSKYGRDRKALGVEEIMNLFRNFRFVIPGGSVMSALGTNSLTSLSNCFVIGSPQDNYTSIMRSRTEQVHLMKRRGGVGYDLSNLRPSGSPVNNAAGTSTGPQSFMEVCSSITKEVAQDGRRGALMLSMDIRHPDSIHFITMKQDLTKVTGANVSVKVPDDFMLAVEKDEEYTLKWPVDSINPKYTKVVKARELWDTLIHCAWNTAEPGILFIDRIHGFSPDGVYEDAKAVSTNPCGEIPMGPYDSCRLIHINLTAFVVNPFENNAYFDHEALHEVAYNTMVLADDLVDLEIEAIDRILEKVRGAGDYQEAQLWEKIKASGVKYRRTGVGFTGLADTLAMLGFKLSSSVSMDAIESIMITKIQAELSATTDMAILRGPFPGYDATLENSDSEWHTFMKLFFIQRYPRMQKYGRRNLSFSTVAPTGTVSIMAGVSSGIEPVFMAYYMRRRKCSSPNDRVDFIDQVGEKFTEFPVIHPPFKKWIQSKSILTPEEVDKLTKAELEEYFKRSPWYGSTSPEIDWMKRVQIQGIVQKYTTHAISSTVNMPESTTEKEIDSIYRAAWKEGLKGITVYRDNCRQGILNNLEDKPQSDGRQAPKRPKALDADYYQVKSKGRLYIVLVGLLDNRPYEVFTFEPLRPVNIEPHRGKIIKLKKGHYSFDSEHIHISDLQLSNTNIEEKASTLYTSMLLRHGADINFVIKTAKKVNDNITSFSSAMCRVLAKYIPAEMKKEACPECGGTLIHEGGCEKCLDCTYSKCL